MTVTATRSLLSLAGAAALGGFIGGALVTAVVTSAVSKVVIEIPRQEREDAVFFIGRLDKAIEDCSLYTGSVSTAKASRRNAVDSLTTNTQQSIKASFAGLNVLREAGCDSAINILKPPERN